MFFTFAEFVSQSGDNWLLGHWLSHPHPENDSLGSQLLKLIRSDSSFFLLSATDITI